MSSVAQAITVPRDSANDDHGIVVRWLHPSGAKVQAGETICELEFSKAVVEIETPVDGFIQHQFQEGDEAPVGETLAVVFDDCPTNTIVPDAQPAQGAASSGGSAHFDSKVSVKAQKLIDQHGLQPSLFAEHPIVKERHVLQYLNQQAQPQQGSSKDGDERIELTPIRRRAAAALSQSWRETPHSQLTRWLDAQAVEEHVQQLSSQHDLAISVSDLLVQAAATCTAADERVRRHWSDAGVLQSPQVNIGFALNQSNGDLLVPVVANADGMDLETLVGRIRGIQKAAIRKKLTPDDLSGGVLTVTSLVGSHVHNVAPIIAPQQSVILALADRMQMGGVDAFALTIAFDHRVLNGSEAAEFLTAVANQLENKS